MNQNAIIVQGDIKAVTQAEWQSINPSVKSMAVDMTMAIKEAHEKVAQAKRIAEEAPNLKGGFLGFGKQKKINAALSEAQVITNEALFDLSELIQQSIKFTIRSVKTAIDMQKALAYLAVNGIRDANGRVESLSSECAESINTIIESAQDFVSQQAEIEDRLIALNDRVHALKNEFRKQYEALKEMRETLSIHSDRIERQGQKLSESIEHLRGILVENQKITEERIKSSETELREIIASNKQFEKKERDLLRDEYQTDIRKMKSTLIIFCGSIAAVAITALILSIVL